MAFKMSGFSAFTKTVDPVIGGDSKLYTKNKNYLPKKNETWESYQSRTDNNWQLSDNEDRRILEKNMYYDPEVGLFVKPTPIIRK